MNGDESSQYRIPPDAHQPAGYGAPPGYGIAPGHGAPPGYVPYPGYGPYPGYASYPGYGVARGYGAPVGYAAWPPPPAPRAWPHGPQRPGLVTSSAVLGFVTGGLTALGSIMFLISLATGDGDLPTALLLLGIPCAAGLITGGVQLLRRRSPWVLIFSALAAVAVLVVVLLAGVLTFSSGDDVMGLFLFVLFALPLPIVTASLAWQRIVSAWVAAAPGP